MRRIWLPLTLTVLLAACGTAPQQTARKPASSTGTALRSYSKPPPGFPEFVDHSVGREEISIQAMALVGVPYRWGGNTPDAGFDCSGLVRYVVDRAASVNLPRTTAEMSGRGEFIEPDQVAPGDLIFFNTTGRPHSHVGIYVGKLRFVNAPSTGGTVRLDYLTNPYWAKRFDGIRRVAPPKAAPTPFDAPTYVASPAQPVAPAASSNVSSYARQASSASGDSGAALRPSSASASVAAYSRQPAALASAHSADAFEPPPVSLSAAQRQSGASASADAYPRQPALASAHGADAFEPPPASLSAAQRQSAASASADAYPRQPALASAHRADAFEPPPSSLSAAQRQAQAAGARASAAIEAAPDPIQAAADAFEPPPPTSRMARQQAQAAQTAVSPEPAEPPVRVMRASTGSLTAPRAAPNDDPIARFANGSN
ncbi:NlpC/P60 family protein [Caballeronia sp. Lep1P3]|uniref:NlpC/P60 family protein n=1 Tax=Caballeronia sp. Lep1P3 TaxID=2878150 RepID=UPI001FD00CA2|nr:C40 family peptidase [Caballeronia sp. Lep1P3]